MTSPICIEIHSIIFLDRTNRFLCQLRYIQVFHLAIIITIGEPKECNYYVFCNVTLNYKNTLYISISQVSIIIYRLLEKKRHIDASTKNIATHFQLVLYNYNYDIISKLYIRHNALLNNYRYVIATTNTY